MQREYLTRMLASGVIDTVHYFDAEDVRDHLEILDSPDTFASECAGWREALLSSRSKTPGGLSSREGNEHLSIGRADQER